MSKSADRVRSTLPSWFRMRYDDQSIGWQFIDIIGRSIDELDGLASYISNNRYIGTADTRQPFVCYTARVPGIAFKEGRYISITGDGTLLVRLESFGSFIRAAVPGLNPPHLYQHDICYIDNQTGLLFVHKQYEAVKVAVTSARGEVEAEFKLSLTARPLWTTLDELGVFLSLPRLPGERNEDYIIRLKAASRLRPDGSREGYIRALALDLGLLQCCTWRDGGLDFIIPHRHVNRETILIDMEVPGEGDIITGPNGQLALAGREEYAGKKRMVLYAYGIKLLDLSSDTDELGKILFTDEGFPTDEAIRLKEELDRLAPVKWDYFIWGDAFWDSGGYAILPNMYDPGVRGFVEL